MTFKADFDAALCQRSNTDRRSHTWQTLTYCGLRRRGRRQSARRQEHNYYLDRFSPELALTTISILMLSCLDAFMTLTLLSKGATEDNYLMLQLLNISTEAFIGVKTVVTAIGLLVLLTHAHFKIFNFTTGKQLLQMILAVYSVLIVYELTMLAVIS